MAYEERKALIEKIQQENDSIVITFFLSDREAIPRGIPLPGIKANVAQDVKEVIFNTLTQIGHSNRIDLFIYTRGGDTNAAWPIVSIIREFCDEFNVLIPFRNHSTGTMIALGADKIIMGKMGELSPIDPTTGNQFNPVDELSQGSRKGISVEDLTAYLELAEKKFKLEDVQILDVFKELTNQVHPLALGNVTRVLSQIRMLSRKLLSLHLDNDEHDSRIKKITEALTVTFFSHLHFINRKEAAEILGDDIVITPNDELEKSMMELYDTYAEDLKIRHEFCFSHEMGNEDKKELTFLGGLVESSDISNAYKTQIQLFQRSEIPPNMNVTLQPGQVKPPIIQGLPRSYYWEIDFQNWTENNNEV